MYDNRQNNRFSIFIGAIVVSLLVLITGCSSAQKEINTDEPITEDSSNPVTLTVYLTAHYANPDTHCPIYEKLLDYQKENPNFFNSGSRLCGCILVIIYFFHLQSTSSCNISSAGSVGF